MNKWIIVITIDLRSTFSPLKCSIRKEHFPAFSTSIILPPSFSLSLSFSIYLFVILSIYLSIYLYIFHYYWLRLTAALSPEIPFFLLSVIPVSCWYALVVADARLSTIKIRLQKKSRIIDSIIISSLNL